MVNARTLKHILTQKSWLTVITHTSSFYVFLLVYLKTNKASKYEFS